MAEKDKRDGATAVKEPPKNVVGGIPLTSAAAKAIGGIPVEEKAPPKSKRERFRSLAEKRVSNALKALRNVGRMGNAASYEYTRTEADMIVAAIRAAVDDAADAFAESPNGKPTFKLF